MKYFGHILIIIIISLSACAQQTESEVRAEADNNINYTIQIVIDDLNIPWGMAFLPDDSMLVTEKKGDLIHFKDGEKNFVSGVPDILVQGQGGFLDVKLHPKYTSNGWIYFTYASSQGGGNGGNTTLMRAKLENNQLVSKEVLYKAEPNTTKGAHFGSRIEFDNDGYIYFSIGDRGSRDVNPQDLSRDGGKIYRLHDDGSIPNDNPFVNTEGAKKAIYSYGHRNPQGMIRHPETGDIWTHEHGPKGGDEINIISSGKNYGWPKISYGINYDGTTFTEHTSLPGMEQPLFYWVPSIAPSGMAFVTSNKYPNWKENLLVGSLSFQYLERLELVNNKVVKREKLLDKMGRVRNVVQGPDGYIYVAIENKGVVRIIPEK